ncbi:MAG TPA: protein kinase [Kofleriaceae bacterium]|nr:protein kinase [Kofleriaceae bacterium]
MIDRQLGAYRILRELGRGGMGVVYAAEHTLIGRKAAVKVIHTALSAREEVIQRFFNEARAAATIDDPGTVQVLDFGNDTAISAGGTGSAYLVMELLAGETLAARLQNGSRLEPVDALRITRQVANTLAKAHAKNIVHRDLKPENIFIVRDDEVPGGERPKVLDFGIAKLLQDPGATIDTGTGEVLGTPMYMSPEQCSGARHVDHRADIYALGCVLFRMLTGRPPFLAEGMGDLIALHLREPPTPPSQIIAGLAPELDMLVLRCLEKDVATRFQSMTELMDAIGRINTPGVPRVDTAKRARPIIADPITPSLARGETMPASDSVAEVTPIKRPPDARADTARAVSPEAEVDAPMVRSGAGRGFRIIAALVVIAAVALLIARPWKRRSSSTDDEAGLAPPGTTDADSPVDASPTDAGPDDADAPLPDAASTLPADAGRQRTTPRPPRDAGVAAPALPIDARQRTMVDLDNDGIPDRR